MGTLQVRGSKELLLADVVEIKFLLGGNCSFADEIVSDTVGSSTADCVAEFEQTPPSIAAIKFIFGIVEFARIESILRSMIPSLFKNLLEPIIWPLCHHRRSSH